MKKLLVFLFLLSAPFVAHAQAQGVHGKVLNPTQFALYDTTIHITSAQLKADSATPVTLVPAQGAGTIINPQSIVVSVNGDGSQYSSYANGKIYASLGTYGVANSASVSDNGVIFSQNLTGNAGNFIMMLGNGTAGTPTLLTGGYLKDDGIVPVTDSIANQPLILTMDHSLYGPGTATLDVEVIYSIHKQ